MCEFKLVVKVVPAIWNSKSNICQCQKDIYKKSYDMSLLRKVMSLHMTSYDMYYMKINISIKMPVVSCEYIQNTMAYKRIHLSSLKEAREKNERLYCSIAGFERAWHSIFTFIYWHVAVAHVCPNKDNWEFFLLNKEFAEILAEIAAHDQELA